MGVLFALACRDGGGGDPTDASAGDSCGDGVVDAGEVCDDGNADDLDGCTAACAPASCGDGLRDELVPGVSALVLNYVVGGPCGGPETFDVAFMLDGNEVARVSETGLTCLCYQGAHQLRVSDPAVLDTLSPEGNRYGVALTPWGDPATEPQLYWATVTLEGTDDSIRIYEYEPGLADAEALFPCSWVTNPNEGFEVERSPTVEVLEACDDGNDLDGDGCDADCTVTACGNGRVTDGEDCDPGDPRFGSLMTVDCDIDCTVPECGDGVVNALVGEFCDDGNNVDDDGCTACGDDACGDGIVQVGETCDDANAENGDGCSFGCLLEGCGDGVIQVGEACDPGPGGGDGSCVGCQMACGDGDVDPLGPDADAVFLRWLASDCGDSAMELWLDGEFLASYEVESEFVCYADEEIVEVDEPGLKAALRAGAHDVEVRVASACLNASYVVLDIDGEELALWAPFGTDIDYHCDAYAWYTGSVLPIYAEACDDGGAVSADGCSASCGREVCGNGVLDVDEGCDDGGTAEGDGCDDLCRPESCGDGVVDEVEGCDDGERVGGDGCSVLCTVEACGDGRLDVGEACDDGARDGGDGCDAHCAVEACGNGVKDVGEGCDDGATEGGDGCSSVCLVEGCDPAGDGDGDGLTDCVETGTGLFVDANDSGSNPEDPDTDDDGLLDGDEVLERAPGLNLLGMGCDPNHRDLLLEADWVASELCDDIDGLAPGSRFEAYLESTFAAMPILNPSGRWGIHAVVDRGQGGGYEGGNRVEGFEEEFAAFGGTYFDIEAEHFARKGWFHYLLFSNGFQTTGYPWYGGMAFMPGWEVHLGPWCGGAEDWGSVTVHELGHNLGLDHGGPYDGCNYKPNYDSVMNYGNGAYDTDCDGLLEANPLFSVGALEPLDENALDESLGVCGSWEDWDDDGKEDVGFVSVDLNSSESGPCGGPLTVLEDRDDYAGLDFVSGTAAVAPIPGALRVDGRGEGRVCDERDLPGAIDRGRRSFVSPARF